MDISWSERTREGKKTKSTMYVHRAQNGINRKTRKTKSPNHGNQFTEIHGIEKRMNKEREFRTVENQGEPGRGREREAEMEEVELEYGRKKEKNL